MGSRALAGSRSVLLARGRLAHSRHRYAEAYDALSVARTLGPLEAEDCDRLADAAWWIGQAGECLRLTESVHQAFLDAGLVDRAALRALDLAGMLAMRGEPALAAGWLSRARGLLAREPVRRAHGLLWYADLSLALAEDRVDDADRLSARLAELGAAGRDATIGVLAGVGAGLVALHRGRVGEAVALLEDAVMRAVGGDVEPEWAGHAHCTVVSACLEVGDLERARHWADVAARWLDGFDEAVMFSGVCRAHAVHLMVCEGEWATATAEAVKVVTELGPLNVDAVAEAEYQRGECLRLTGEQDAAHACFARAEALGREPQPGRALLLLDSGRQTAAWESICSAVAHVSRRFEEPRLLRAQVEIALATGREAGAREAADRLRELAEACGTTGFLAWADQVDTMIALAEGRPAEAIDISARAAARLRRTRQWFDVARVDALRAEAFRMTGDTRREHESRTAAEVAFRRMGSRRRPGGGGPGGQAGGLTTRETEVLAIVARGLTNREVATALTISEATVRRHLANIYRKLDVGSRTAAAAWAHDRDIV